MIKKLLIALILSLLPQVVFGALVTKDDFTRANSTVVNDATHPWVERQVYGESSINTNRLQWEDQSSLTTTPNNYTTWTGDYCFNDCTIQVDLGFSSTSGDPLGVGITSSIASDVNTCAFSLVKTPSNGYITPREKGCGVDGAVWTAGTEVGSTITQNETERVYLKIYKSGNDVLMDACWGPIANPCSEWSKLGYNLTAAGVDIKSTQGFPALHGYGSTSVTAKTFYFDDFSLDIPKTSGYKPWLSNLSPSGVSVQIKSSSISYNTAVQYGTSPTLATYTETTGVTPLADDELITQNAITGLSAGTKYYYRIKIGDTVDSSIYSFTTLPTPGAATSFSFGVVACTTEANWGWAVRMKALNPLFILGIGDFPYVDERGVADKAGFLYAYRAEMFNYSDFQDLAANIPIYYMWNDHDSGWDEAFGEYGNALYTTGTVATTNNVNGQSCSDNAAPCTITGTGTTWTSLYMGAGTGSNYDSNLLSIRVAGDNFDYKVSSRTDTTLTLTTPYHGATGTGLSYQLFKEMRGVGAAYPKIWKNPTPPVGYDSDAGYYTFQVGRTKFWVLDAQKYTSNYDNTDGPSKTMLGTNQKNWLINTYKADSAPLKFFVSPEPLITARDTGGKQEWHLFYNYETKWLESLLRQATGKTMYLTGDSHQLAFAHPFLIPSVLEINSSKAGVINSSHSKLWTEGRRGWVEDWMMERRGFAFITVTDNGTDITAKVDFYYSIDGSIARTINFSTTDTRATICDYDATFCPSGRGAP